MLAKPDVCKRAPIRPLIVPALSAVVLGSVALTSACLLEDDRCGPNMVLKQGLCMCVEGASVKNNECVITDAGGPAPTSGLGAPCSETAPCTGSEAPLCQTARSGERYCTATGCNTDADCTNAYRCIQDGSTSYCRRPSSGQAEACSSTADCAKFDANYCSTLLGICLIRDCTSDSCDIGYTCWDASAYAPGVFICRPEVAP